MPFIIRVWEDLNYITLKDRCPRCQSSNLMQYCVIDDSGEKYFADLICKDCRFDFSAEFFKVAEIPMTEKEYLEEKGQLCPICRSNHIEATDAPNVGDISSWQNIYCCNCGAEWRDLYKLSGFKLENDYIYSS